MNEKAMIQSRRFNIKRSDFKNYFGNTLVSSRYTIFDIGKTSFMLYNIVILILKKSTSTDIKSSGLCVHKVRGLHFLVTDKLQYKVFDRAFLRYKGLLYQITATGTARVMEKYTKITTIFAI